MRGRAVLRRLAQALGVLLLAFSAAFVLLAALPSNAVLARYGGAELGLSAEQLAEIAAVYGLDQPLWLRYLNALGGFLRGDLGYSVQYGTPVAELIAAALPGTLTLAILGLAAALMLAVAITALACTAPFGWLRSLLRSLPPVIVSLPVFWIAILLIQVFSFQLGLVPVIGATGWQELLLPVMTLAIALCAPIAQVLTRSVDEVRELPFTDAVRARGAGAQWLFWRNLLPNALLPTLTVAGVIFGELLGGAIITETVFGRVGIGNLTLQAVSNRDTPVLLALVVLAAAVFVLVNLLVDLLAPRIDPRLKTERGRLR